MNMNIKHNQGWMQSIYQFKDMQNAKKYLGTKPPICRSSWERRFCSWCDLNNKVLMWGSERVKIPYIWQGKPHTYYTDFFVILIDNNNNIRKFIIEIKPHGQGPFANKKGQISRPREPKNRTVKALKRYLYEVQRWEKNAAKWAAAQSYCAHHNLEFIILSEEDLL